MRDTSLRWGLGMGAAGAAVGAVALIVGALISPVALSATNPEALATALFVRGVLVLLSLGVALSLAYYGGMRIERPTADVPPPAPRETVLAGAVALTCYWAITTLYIYALGAIGQRPSALTFIESRLLFGVVCVVLGAGMGGLGGQAARARGVLASVFAAPALPHAPLPSAPEEPPPAAEP